MRGGAIALGGLVLPGVVGRGNGLFTGRAQALPPSSFDSLPSFGAAMHIHTSSSEGPASMEAALSEARRVGLSQVIITEHDWRLSAQGYRQKISFDSLTYEREEPNPAWKWLPNASGRPATGEGGIVTSPVSPLDTSATPGALRVRTISRANTTASYRYLGSDDNARSNFRANVTGQRIQLEVLASQVGPDAWLELLIRTSYRPARNGRKAGHYDLSYRFGTAPAGRSVVGGLVGVINVPVTPGAWTSVAVTPLDDIKALWPDIKAEDNSTCALWLGSTSRNGAAAEGYFDYMRFTRDTAGDKPLLLLDELIGYYRSRYPTLVVERGLEVSLYAHHTNWFGGDQHLFDYSTVAGRQVVPADDPTFQTKASDLIHASGGLSSVNHPFGAADSTKESKTGTPAARTALRQSIARQMLDNAAYHADILEVGYRARGSALLDDHLALWDAMSRNGRWLTANGVSDDHGGKVGSWDKLSNRFATYTWAPSASMNDLLRALAAGRVFVGELGSFAGTLDLTVEDNPMGSISVRPTLTTRSLRVAATGLADGDIVNVVQGVVDYSGAVDPLMRTVTTLGASSFNAGPCAVQLDTSSSSFVRVDVIRTPSSGAPVGIAFSNPIWLLREMPPSDRAIPSARRAPDTAA